MDLRSALKLAKAFVGRDTQQGMDLVTVLPDAIMAQDGEGRGVRIEIETGVSTEVRVNAGKAEGMARKAKATQFQSGRRGLAVIGEVAGTFQLRITRKHGWDVPEQPATWRSLTPKEVAILRLLGALSSTTRGDHLQSVRLTPYLAHSRRFNTLSVGYVAPTYEPVTVPAVWVKYLEGATEIGLDGPYVFSRSGPVLTWCRAIEPAYTDQSVYDLIRGLRGRGHEVRAVVNLGALLPLVERAALACRVPADAAVLTLSHSEDGAKVSVRMVGDVAGYQGAVEAVLETQGSGTFGFRPMEVAQKLKALRAVLKLVHGHEEVTLGFAGEREPLRVFVAGKPAIEIAITPTFVAGC